MRQLQAALALIVIPVAFFLLWYFPDYKGVVACSVGMLISIFLYLLSERQTV